MEDEVIESKLSEIEKQIESIFAQGKQECLKLIRQIHSERLYLATHKSFEQYMNERWGVSRRRGYQLITAAEALESVNHGTHLDDVNHGTHLADLGERQLREVAKVPEDKRAEVIAKASEVAGDKAPTAKQIADAAKSVIDPEDETEWEPVEDDEDCETEPGTFEVRPAPADPAVDRARNEIPVLVKRLRFYLGNMGANGRFDRELSKIEEFAR